MTKKKQSETITAFKGFDLNMQCRGYQFKVGETFEHEGEVAACESGFHSCENPLDVFAYYPPCMSVYAEVEASGQIARHAEDSKVASARLHVKAALSLPDYISRAFEWVRDHCTSEGSNHATGYRSASLATGWYSSSDIKPAQDAKPLHAVAIATGYQSRARAPTGSAIVLVERDDEGEIVNIRASKVGENGVKQDTWYTLRGGEFVVVE